MACSVFEGVSLAEDLSICYPEVRLLGHMIPDSRKASKLMDDIPRDGKKTQMQWGTRGDVGQVFDDNARPGRDIVR